MDYKVVKMKCQV